MFKVGEKARVAPLPQVLPRYRGQECEIIEVAPRAIHSGNKIPFDYKVSLLGEELYAHEHELRKLLPPEEKSAAEKKILSLFKVREAENVS